MLLDVLRVRVRVRVRVRARVHVCVLHPYEVLDINDKTLIAQPST